MESEIRAVFVSSEAAICGNAGRYISMANGLMVESAPRIRMIKVRLCVGCDIRRKVKAKGN
jgi:hypothetical protein